MHGLALIICVLSFAFLALAMERHISPRKPSRQTQCLMLRCDPLSFFFGN